MVGLDYPRKRGNQMANPEACELWIEQRIEEEQDKGTSHPEIGRIIGAEIVKLFEAKIQARTIEQRSRRIVATNVAAPPTPESSNENQDNQDSEPEHGGYREGAGRKPKYHRPTIPKKENPSDDIYTEAFLDAFNTLFTILKNAKRLGWKDVSREAAMKHLAVLYDLLTIN